MSTSHLPSYHTGEDGWVYSYTPSICLHWHKWQCAADEISVLFDWKPFDSKHISSLSSTPSSAFSLLGSLINSTWLSAKTAPAINLVILIKAGKVHCTQWLNLVKTALSLPTKRHHFDWGREEKSGPAWKSSMWNQTFYGGEAGVNHTIFANICVLRESHALPKQEFCECRLYKDLLLVSVPCQWTLEIAVFDV